MGLGWGQLRARDRDFLARCSIDSLTNFSSSSSSEFISVIQKNLRAKYCEISD